MARSTRVEGHEASRAVENRQKSGAERSSDALQVRPGAVLALLVVALAAAGLATFQWVELLRVQAGGTTFCSINESFNCSVVWQSGFAKAVQDVTRLPVAGWGLVWALCAFAASAVLFLRARAGRIAPRNVAAIAVVAAVGVFVSLGLLGVTLKLGVSCPTCLVTYLLVGAFAVLAFRFTPLSRLAAPDLLGGAGLAGAFALGGYLLLLYPGLKTPSPNQELALVSPSAKRDAGTTSGAASGAASGRGTGDLLGDYLMSLEPDAQQFIAEILASYRIQPTQPRDAWPPRRVLRDPAAPVKILEWSDIRCGHCKRFSEVLHQLDGSSAPEEFSIELRQFPLDGTCNPHVPSDMVDPSGVRCTAAKALICVESQPGFLAAQEKMFASQENLTRERVLEIAAEAGVPRPALESCIASSETAAKLKADVDFAAAYQLEGTPLIVLNGREVPGMAQFVYAMILAKGDAKAPGWDVLPKPPKG